MINLCKDDECVDRIVKLVPGPFMLYSILSTWWKASHYKPFMFVYYHRRDQLSAEGHQQLGPQFDRVLQYYFIYLFDMTWHFYNNDLSIIKIITGVAQKHSSFVFFITRHSIIKDGAMWRRQKRCYFQTTSHVI